MSIYYGHTPRLFARPQQSLAVRIIQSILSLFTWVFIIVVVAGVIAIPVVWYGGIAYIVVHFVSKVW